MCQIMTKYCLNHRAECARVIVSAWNEILNFHMLKLVSPMMDNDLFYFFQFQILALVQTYFVRMKSGVCATTNQTCMKNETFNGNCQMIDGLFAVRTSNAPAQRATLTCRPISRRVICCRKCLCDQQIKFIVCLSTKLTSKDTDKTWPDVIIRRFFSFLFWNLKIRITIKICLNKKHYLRWEGHLYSQKMLLSSSFGLAFHYFSNSY